MATLAQSTSRDDLLTALAHEPDDDALRQVYADALEEQSDPRAEFIRANLALWNAALSPTERRMLEARTTALLARFGSAWEAPVRALCGGTTVSVFYNRGLPEGIRLTPETLALHGPALALSHVRRLVFIYDAALDPLLASPFTPHLVDLTLYPNENFHAASDEQFAQLFRAPGWTPSIRSLQIHVSPVGGQCLAAIASGAFPELYSLKIERGHFQSDALSVLLGPTAKLPKLERLFFVACGYTDAAIVPFAKCNAFSLRELSLPTNQLQAHGAQCLAESPCLERLEILGLENNSLKSGGIAALCTRTAWSSLHTLRLSLNRLGPDDGKTLGESRAWPALRTLNLSTNPLGSSGLAALASGGGLEELTSLNVTSNNATEKPILAIAKGFPRLTELILRANKLSPKSGPLLVAAPFNALRALDLGGNLLGDTGLQTMATAPWLANLESLWIDQLKGATNLGILQFLREANLRSLRWLNIANGGFTEAVLQQLATSPLLGQLTVLEAGGNRCDTSSVRALARSKYTDTLVDLNLHSMGLTDAHAKILSMTTGFAALRRLDLTGNPLGFGRGLAALRERFPEATIIL